MAGVAWGTLSPATRFSPDTRPVCASEVAAMTTIVTEQSWLHPGLYITTAKMDSGHGRYRVGGDSPRGFTVVSKGANGPAELRWSKMGHWGLF